MGASFGQRSHDDQRELALLMLELIDYVKELAVHSDVTALDIQLHRHERDVSPEMYRAQAAHARRTAEIHSQLALLYERIAEVADTEHR